MSEFPFLVRTRQSCRWRRRHARCPHVGALPQSALVASPRSGCHTRPTATPAWTERLMRGGGTVSGFLLHGALTQEVKPMAAEAQEGVWCVRSWRLWPFLYLPQ